MIITKIIGGLGNQLFQYAAGKALALQHNTKLLLDISSFNEYKLRNFDLAAFHTVLNFARQEDVETYINRNSLQKIRDNLFPIEFRKVYKPKHFHFHERFFKAPPDIYLQGYWQSEKFFQPVADIIRSEFTMRDEYSHPVHSLAQTLSKENSVSVHIRRGDYANPQVIDMHGMLPASHYIKAIALVKEKYPDAIFYFFSDDMKWVQENIHVDNTIYVSGKLSNTHWEDFYLMSQCKHNIIANSSFSWWAAWLNNNPQKTVIAPKRWFNNGPKDTQDLIPENWHRI